MEVWHVNQQIWTNAATRAQIFIFFFFYPSRHVMGKHKVH